MDYTSLACCTLAFVLYLNTLNAGFVYDDRRAILSNTDVTGKSPWLGAFAHDYWGTPLLDSGSHGSYRPLCVLSFRLNFLLGGYTPWGYHLINNLLHCLATGLVVKLARHFLVSIWGVAAAGALFAAHPIHTEAVAGIVGRADLAACIFYLLTYLTYVRHIMWRERGDYRHWPALTVAVFLALVALLFKETAITALLVCGLFDALRGLYGFQDKHRWRSLCVLGSALAFIICCRLSMLPRPQTAFSTADNPVAKVHSVWARFLTFVYLPVFNFKLLLLPQLLSFDWGMDAIPHIATIWDHRNFLSIVFYGIISGVIWHSSKVLWCQRKKCNLAWSASTAQYQYIHTHRKSRTKKKYPISTTRFHASYNAFNNYHATPVELITTNLEKAPTVDGCICQDCKQSLGADQHLSSCQMLNNNNNVAAPPISAYCTNVYNDCCCHHLLSASGGATHLFTFMLYKAIASVTLRSSRSSSCCSNSTTASNKSSSSSNSSSSMSSTNSQFATPKYALAWTQLPPRCGNACVLLMTLAFLILPFLPATNLFFYVGFVVAERLLYLPSIGYCLLIGFGIAKLMEPLRWSAAARNRRIALIFCMSLVLSMLCARTMRRNLDWHDEENLYRSAISVNPPKALGNLGSVLSSQARYEEAKEVLIAALRYRPNMADVHFNLGILHQNQRNYQSAVDSFKRAIHFRPNLVVAYLNMGISLIALGRCQDAAHVLQEGANIRGVGVRDRSAHDNARISSYLQLGAIYVEQGKLQRALAIYREALHTLPTNCYQRDVLYHRIGDVFGRLQQWDEAEKHHKVALELKPDQVAAHLSYGITLARNRSRSSEAESWFKRALQLAPSQASAYHHYAEFLSAHSRNGEAIYYRIRAAELSPADYALVVATATTLRMLDRKEEAENWYRKAVALRPDDAHAHTNLGAILHLLGRTSNAAASYREALRLQPNDPTTLGNLAKLQMHSTPK